VAWTKAHLHAKWHLDPSSHLAEQTWAESWRGGSVPPAFWGRQLGPHQTQCGQDRGLPACQVSSWPIQRPRYTDVTHRTDRTTVRWLRANRFTNGRPKTVRHVLWGRCPVCLWRWCIVAKRLDGL